MADTDEHEVVVIGGGAAGLSAAVALARSRRSVLVVDDGHPRNAPADGVHNLLGQEGIAPAALLAAGRAELASYDGRVRQARVVAVARSGGDGRAFTVTLDDGSVLGARRIVLATGLVDRLPGVAGVAERWGRDVLHCPYCHGWEVRGRAIAVLGCGAMAVHQALLFGQLSDDVTLITHDTVLDDDERARLGAAGVAVVDGTAEALVVEDDALAGVRLAGGALVAAQALTVQPRFEARADLLAALGLAAVEHPMGMGEHVPVDDFGRTEVPGIWAAGNVTDLGAQVMGAAAAGTKAGAMVNMDLIEEDLQSRLPA
jgi:thioredoxin reductase